MHVVVVDTHSFVKISRHLFFIVVVVIYTYIFRCYCYPFSFLFFLSRMV